MKKENSNGKTADLSFHSRNNLRFDKSTKRRTKLKSFSTLIRSNFERRRNFLVQNLWAVSFPENVCEKQSENIFSASFLRLKTNFDTFRIESEILLKSTCDRGKEMTNGNPIVSYSTAKLDLHEKSCRSRSVSSQSLKIWNIKEIKAHGKEIIFLHESRWQRQHFSL